MEAVPGLRAIETSAAGVTVRSPVPVIPFEEAVIVLVPTPVLVAKPVAFTVKTVVSLELQVAVLVKSCVLPSV